ncbi:MAG TPA: 3-oxoacyl-[acyl-carrier-protein] synthase III C-terminal domain-containing protein [bacterium]|nr:3-oxoacyl-[acyl-carrier-protein] synthase III C-terminal domain-containing protein [bacterium]
MTSAGLSRQSPRAAAASATAAAALVNTAVAVPSHAYSQGEIRDVVCAWLAHDPALAARAAAVLAHAEIERRYTVRPAEWYLTHTALGERSAVYKEEMIRLCERAVREALEGAGVPAEAVGLIVSTSCTGLMIPSVEAYLMNRLPFRADTRRQPLTALGCAAGAAAIGQATTWLQANPERAALILSAELASLTAQVGDFSMANIVSVALFGDGAAATVAVGARYGEAAAGGNGNGNGATDGPAPPRRPARVLATRSVLFPNSEDLMGFDLSDGGLKIFLLPRVPRFLRREMPGQVASFLEEHGLRLEDLTHFLLHPGGRKVLEGLEDRLHLTRAQTRLSWQVLRDYGNLSSATVLFLLHAFEREAAPAPGDYGLLAAVGPGFSAELVLLQW